MTQPAETNHRARLTFREFIELVNPKYRFYRHCDELIAVLQQVADKEIRRLMVFMPPRHGKSELVSRLFPAYYLLIHPEQFVAIASYGADLAYTLSRAARENFQRAGGALHTASRAVKHWQTEQGGGLWAAGVGGPATGKGFHLGIIDDPIKDAKEAASSAKREGDKDWYGAVWSTREEPEGSQIVVQTRWHEDDLAGYLLELEQEEPEGWHIVNLAAIAESMPEFPATCTVHQDWREAGEALCPERYPLEKLQRFLKRLGDYFFGALFQQRPRPRDGGLFTNAVEIVGALPVDVNLKLVRYWDKAGAATHRGDYTVGVLAGQHDGITYIIDVVRGQWPASERNRRIRETAQLDQQYGRVNIWIEQPPGLGKESTDAVIQFLAGFIVRGNPVVGDKIERAEPFAVQWQAGNVRLLRADWNRAFIEELRAFPNGANDDQVDAAAGAFSKLVVETVATGKSINLWQRR